MHNISRAVLLAVSVASLLLAQTPNAARSSSASQTAKSAQSASSTQTSNRDVEQRVERILRQMTLEEKIDMIGEFWTVSRYDDVTKVLADTTLDFYSRDMYARIRDAMADPTSPRCPAT